MHGRARTRNRNRNRNRTRTYTCGGSTARASATARKPAAAQSAHAPAGASKGGPQARMVMAAEWIQPAAPAACMGPARPIPATPMRPPQDLPGVAAKIA